MCGRIAREPRRANRGSGSSCWPSAGSSSIALVRAAWIQVVEGGRLREMASRQHREDDRAPGRARHALRPQRRAARDRRAGDDRLRRPAAGRRPTKAAVKAGGRSASTPTSSTERSGPVEARSSSSTGRRIPSRRGSSSGWASPGFGFYPEERRFYPQGRGRVARARLRRHGQQGPRRARALARQDARGRPGYEIVVRDPAGRAIDVVTSRRERPGRNVVLTLDHQLQASAGDPPRDRRRPLGREGRDGDRDGPAHGRDPRDGERADVRRERVLRLRAARRGATAPSPTSTSPARRSRS